MIEDCTGWSELTLLNPGIKRSTGSAGIWALGQNTFSLGVVHLELCCLCNKSFVFSFPYLAGMDLFLIVFTTCTLLGIFCNCLLVEHQKETKQVPKQQNLAIAKGNRVWPELKTSQETEAYTNAFCLNQGLKPRHLCPEAVAYGNSLIPICTKPVGWGRLAFGSCALLQHSSVSLAPWSLGSSNRFPHLWHQICAWAFNCDHIPDTLHPLTQWHIPFY